MSTKELRRNDRIDAPTVRVVGEAGEQFGVKEIEEARRLADEAGLDLVLVAPDAEPPVCKIMDYGKFKYQHKKRQHEQHKHQPQMKELRLRPKTEAHDLMVRVRKAQEFLGRGDRVLVNLRFRGRELAHKELASALLQRFANMLEDIAKIETPPRMEGRRMVMILAKK